MKTKARKDRLIRLCRVQNWRCFYCEGKMNRSLIRFRNSGASPSIERLVPGQDGGTYERINTVASCRGCNSSRPLISAEKYKEVRLSLRTRWPACSDMPKEIRYEMKKEYGYPTGPIEVDTQRLVETID